MNDNVQILPALYKLGSSIQTFIDGFEQQIEAKCLSKKISLNSLAIIMEVSFMHSGQVAARTNNLPLAAFFNLFG